MLEQDMRRIWTVILIVVLIILVGVAAYLFGKNQEQTAIQIEAVISPEAQTAVPTLAVTQTMSATPAAGSAP
ncbi:MAG: hypothetical protein KA035_03295, partial [Candidatus Levybacteria bacterium]|nr:hypothetical protein [Candidatus Levybacteria bacterium]